MLLAADQLHRRLDVVDRLGWDSQPGEELLQAVRSHIVCPVVRRTGLTGPDARLAEATGWATAWEVLRRPSAREAANPAGMVWVAVRRAVHAEVRALRADGNGPLGVRVWEGITDDAVADGVVGLGAFGTSSEPGETPDGPMGDLLALVIDLLVDVGWDRAVVSRVVTELSDAFPAPQGSGQGGGLAWRRVARARGVAQWQVRRLGALLVGGSGAPGLLWLMVREGPGILADPAAAAAIAATTGRWSATPEAHLRAFGPAPAPDVPSRLGVDPDETCICHRTGAKRTVPPDRAPVGAPGARAAGPTSALHGGLEGRHRTRTRPPAPDSPEYP